MPLFTPFTGDQARQLINSEEAYSAFIAAWTERESRFRGSMTWKKVKNREYLYRKRRGKWESLGSRNPATEETFERFHSGRAAILARLGALEERIRVLAPINRAMQIGRMPFKAAQILRRLDRRQLLGKGLSVAGTHALYAYERMAGGRFHSSQLATDDIDLLFDDRHKLNLVGGGDAPESLLQILRRSDESFSLQAAGSYRASDAQGFMVDLIKPMPRNPAASSRPRHLGAAVDDLHAVEIEGLAWLQNSKQVTVTVVDDRGFPGRLVVPDPRAFSLHKYWVSLRRDRDPLKARRDHEQALAVALLVQQHLPSFPFDPEELKAFPAPLRTKLPRLLEEAKAFEMSTEDWL